VATGTAVIGGDRPWWTISHETAAALSHVTAAQATAISTD
jgi:hypothetical protein